MAPVIHQRISQVWMSLTVWGQIMLERPRVCSANLPWINTDEMSAASKDKVARMKMLLLKQYHHWDMWYVMQVLKSFMAMIAIHQILHESKYIYILKKSVKFKIRALHKWSPVLAPVQLLSNLDFNNKKKINSSSSTEKHNNCIGMDPLRIWPPGFWQLQCK